MKNKTNDGIGLVLMSLIMVFIVAMVVGIIAYSINTLGLEEYLERLKRLEKWMW